MPDEAASYLVTQTAALVGMVTALGVVGLCFGWAGRMLRRVLP